MKIYNTAFRDSQSAVLFIIIQMWLVERLEHNVSLVLELYDMQGFANLWVMIFAHFAINMPLLVKSS